MIEQMFAKKTSPRMKESIKRAFSKLEPVSKMKPNNYELPITSIRRILGDDFFMMEKTSDDVIRLFIFDNGGFNIEEFRNNVDKAGELTQYITTWFQGFLEANNFVGTFTPEFMDRKIAKVCITSPAGLVCKEICLNDIKSISMFGDDGVILGMKNIKEIGQISQELQKNDQAFEQMRSTGNMKAIEALNSQRQEYLTKLSKYQCEIIEEWLRLIKEWSGVEDVKSVFDVSIMFATKFTSDDGKDAIAQTSLYTYHDGGAKTVSYFKRKFSVDEEVAE